MKPDRFMSVKEAAEKRALSTRRVQSYCVAGRIPGAEKWGYAWMIPADAEHPEDGRRMNAAKSAMPPPHIRESPLLTMTDILSHPGHVDEANLLIEDG